MMMNMDLSEFKSLYRSWNPFHYPDFNSLFPQPVLPPESSSSDLIQFDPPPTYQDPSRGGVQNPPPGDGLILKEGSLSLMNQPAVSGVTMKGVNKTHGTEYMRCNPCNIMCNSKVSWEAHLKKHIKKTQAFHGEVIEGLKELLDICVLKKKLASWERYAHLFDPAPSAPTLHSSRGTRKHDS